MDAPSDKPQASPLANFTIYTVTYKTVDGIEIPADISLPKDLQPGSHPIIVNWHGGGLTTGSRNMESIYPPWLEPFARSCNAIVISPDYRLLPESPIEDVLEDLESFSVWLNEQFPAVLATKTGGKHACDLDRIVITGGSAGGWCALHHCLSDRGDIRALMLQYPSTGILGQFSPEELKKIIQDLLPEWTEEKFLESLKVMQSGQARTSGGWERWNMTRLAKAYGYLQKWQGSGDQRPIERIRDGANLPAKIWIIHGESDSIILPKDSTTLKSKIEDVCPGTEVMLQYFPGEHGFDMSIDPEQLAAGLAWVRPTLV